MHDGSFQESIVNWSDLINLETGDCSVSGARIVSTYYTLNVVAFSFDVPG